ncbi:hypothetical protein Sbal625DRAFT_4145 [Shewanella baltica OS625]|uniref:hypothetical protein n=1 Tax=Shewanella baltica TaxID=62322 RepID=UPI000230DEFF|nr:hypothetical protein [Shewanella baltica]EHC04185.1 hypothetical protein Sbal625DRAFT_4145 [Shewanella baltica OS625]
MSENKPTYEIDSEPSTVAAFKRQACSLAWHEAGFVPPTAAQIKQLRQIMGYSQAQLGVLLGKTISQKGCDKVHKWELPESSKNHKPIEYLAWRMMLQVAGVITVDDDIAVAAKYKEIINAQNQ